MAAFLDLRRVPPRARLPGGKARGLARLLRAGLPVPPAVALPARGLLAADGNLAPGAAANLRAARAALGGGPLAVRSSAADEDRTGGARPGVYHTELNVQGAAALRAAVRRCLESLAARGAAPRSGGVVLQQFLAARCAGVLFTRDPLDRSARLVVEATWGLGPSLADGGVDPDRVVLRRDRFAVLDSRLGRKARRVVPARGGGVRAEPTPPALAGQPALDLAQLEALWQAGRAASRALGGPADVEWCLADGRLYLLQVRPLTTPAPRAVVRPARREGAATAAAVPDQYVGLERPLRGVHSRLLADELWHGAVTPMMLATAGQAIESAMIARPLAQAGLTHRFPGPHLVTCQGRVYVDLAPVRGVLELLPPLAVQEELRRLFPPAERERLARRRGIGAPVRLAAALARFTAQGRDWAPRPAEAAFRDHLAAASRLPRSISGRSLGQLRDDLGRVQRELEAFLRVAVWGVGWAYVFVPLLREICRRWLDDDGQWFARLLADPGGTRTAAYNQDLAALAAAWHAEPSSLRRRVRQQLAVGAHEARRTLAARASADLGARLQRVLERHGHRGLERDLIHPRIDEDLGLLLDLLDVAPAELATRPRDAAAVLEAAVGQLRDPIRRRLLATVRDRAVAHQRLREDLRGHADRYLHALRRLLLGLGEGLVAEGRLAATDDVFFLVPDELGGLVTGHASDLERRLAERRRQYAAFRGRTPPRWLRDGVPVPGDEVEAPAADAAVLRGTPAGPGCATGPARRIDGPADLRRLAPGEVLVAEACDPAWTPAFGRAAAVVTALGGVLSHAAIEARERELPAVVGLGGELSRIRDGMVLEVDGRAGSVRLSTTGGAR